MRFMRIVFLADSFPPYVCGVTTHILVLTRRLLAEGHKILIIAPRYGVRMKVPEGLEGARIVYTPSFGARYFNLRVCWPNALNIYRLIKEFKPDIVESQNPSFLAFDGLLAAIFLKVPFVSTFFTLMPTASYLNMILRTRYARYLSPGVWALHRLLYKGCRRVMVTTPKIKMLLEREGVGESKLVQIPSLFEMPMGVEVTEEKRQVCRKKYHLGEYTAVFVGRISKEKNLEELLGIWSAVIKKIGSAKLLVVGAGEWEKEFAEKISEMGLERAVICTGFLPQEYFLQELLPYCDVFVSTSVSETWGLACIEAMAAKLPVVVYEAYGICEYITKEGFVCKRGDTKSFTEAIIYLFKYKNRRSQMGRSAYLLAQLFGVQRGYTKILGVYTDVIREYLLTSAKPYANV